MLACEMVMWLQSWRGVSVSPTRR